MDSTDAKIVEIVIVWFPGIRVSISKKSAQIAYIFQTETLNTPLFSLH
jgi:hypothetical protein